jgi:hypothetical protein
MVPNTSVLYPQVITSFCNVLAKSPSVCAGGLYLPEVASCQMWDRVFVCCVGGHVGLHYSLCPGLVFVFSVAGGIGWACRCLV